MSYVDDVLTTIGITVKVGTNTIQGAYNYGDLGANAADLDATPLSASHSIKKPGLQDDPAWELSYYYNDTDFDAIEAVRTAGTAVALEVTFADGTKFTNTGICGSNYLTGQGVGQVAQAKASFQLANATGWTKTSA